MATDVSEVLLRLQGIFFMSFTASLPNLFTYFAFTAFLRLFEMHLNVPNAKFSSFGIPPAPRVRNIVK